MRRHAHAMRSLFLSTILFAATPVWATPAGSLAGLTSDGSLGSISALEARFGNDPSVQIGLNTDNGNIYFVIGGGWQPASAYVGGNTVSSLVVPQTNGPGVRVFDFSSFTLDTGQTMYIQGSLPAAIVSQTSIAVNGTIRVSAGGGAAGGGGGSNAIHAGSPGGSTGLGAGGGGGGQQDLGR